jgi:hypothetical protein
MGDSRLHLEPPTEAAGFYSWEAPDKNVTIQLSYDLVDRLSIEVMRGFGAVPRRGAEVGGVLLGTAVLSDRLLVQVNDFEPVPCSYRRGPSYLLSQEEQDEFAETAARYQPIPERMIYAVGFYRSHTREGLGLSPEDLDLFSRHFQNPTDIALLVKPFATRVSMAGLFFRENGRIHSEASYLEFPFRRKELGGGSARSDRNRMDMRSIEEQEEQQEMPVQLGESTASTGSLAVGVTNSPSMERDSNSTLLAPPKLKRGNVWIPLSFIFLILGVLLGFQSALSTKSGATAPTEDPYLLDLTAKKEGDTLHVRWSGKAPILKKARRAAITISDGDYNSTVNMDSTDLQAGNLFYRNLTGLVKFRFEVFASDRTSLNETLEFRAEASATPAPAKK